MMSTRIVLRAVLLLVGVVVVVLGLNVGLGGIRTLGWQGGGEFLTVSDPALFAVRDSHIRFIGGIWLGMGLTLAAGAVWFERLRPVLVAITALIFVGGLVRLGGPLTPDVLPSLALELLGFPLLGWWIARAKA
jgi:hypothetical protein